MLSSDDRIIVGNRAVLPEESLWVTRSIGIAVARRSGDAVLLVIGIIMPSGGIVDHAAGQAS